MMLQVACLLAALNGAIAVVVAPSLKGAAKSDPKDSMEFNAVRTMFSHFEVHAPTSGGDAQSQPVGIQVEEKVMENMQNSLSKDCGKRYNAMINGKGPEMHTFDQHDASAESKSKDNDQCQKELKGEICQTKALIHENKDVPDGRKMVATVKVEGSSCLPKECTGQSDLQVLSQFMHAQTKEVMPGDDVKIDLHVDCAQSGGGVVHASEAGAVSPPSEKSVKKSGAMSSLSLGPLGLLLFWALC